jgi:hypothetical protein
VLAEIAHGHIDFADVCFLIAAILFFIAGLLAAVRRPDPTSGALVPFGLTLTAIALLVL